MAQKIWVLDAPSRHAPAVQPEAAAGHEPPARHDAALRHEVPVQRGSSARPTESPRARAALGVMPLGAPSPQPEPGRPTRLGEETPGTWVKQAPQAPPVRRPFAPVPALAALYLLGGVAPLVLRVGPRKFAWAVVSIVSLTTWVTLAWFWTPLHAAITSGRLPILPVLVGVLLVHAAGTLAWSRAVVRVVRDDRWRSERLPRQLRSPWVVAALGVAVPGMGLAVAGRAVRAGLAAWNSGWLAFAALLLGHASLVWSWNTKSGADALPKTFVEGLFVACAVLVVAGGLAAVAGVLDGARLAGVRRGSRGRARSRAWIRGDVVALALLASLVTFAATFRPARLAHDLDSFAGSLRWSGLALVPLGLERVAAALDPGRPEYMMRVAGLHVEMGNTEAARAIEERLRERWETYAQMLLQTAASGRTTVESAPIEPAHDLVQRAPGLAPSLAGETAQAAQ